MKLSKLAAVALAILLVTAGAVAAAPGNAPAFAGDDEQADDHSDDEDRPDHAGNASGPPSHAADDDAGASAVGTRGPPVELPSAVPDHVAAIHDLIRQHVAGDLDGNLGEAIADVTPDDEDAEA